MFKYILLAGKLHTWSYVLRVDRPVWVGSIMHLKRGVVTGGVHVGIRVKNYVKMAVFGRPCNTQNKDK